MSQEALEQAIQEVLQTTDLKGWWDTPNDAFDGATPKDLVGFPEERLLWEMIHRLRSGEPG